ncbi:response regulator transcription factor [Plantactinospora solaniradicis]|uniref:Response regulator transcription factor n=1 Tax=Plantactinospora solaniradicis TaxID=1723736 RepID=A0ABW1KHQ6_9ACTN
MKNLVSPLSAVGLSNVKNAAQFVVSESTVNTHVHHAFAKIGVRDRTQAVTYALRNGLAG